MSKNYDLTNIKDHAVRMPGIIETGPSSTVHLVQYIKRPYTVIKHSPQSVRVILHITGYFDMITC